MIQNDLKLLKCYRREENEKQLDTTYSKRRSAGNDWRGKIPDTNNKKKTTEVDRTHAKRRLAVIGTVIEG